MRALLVASLAILCALPLSAQTVVTSPNGQPVAVPYPIPTLAASECLPASNALFAVGDTTVTCTHTFTITVQALPLFDWVRDTTELGVIHIPAAGPCPANCPDFAGFGLAYDPARDGLFITGAQNAANGSGEQIGELSIPALGQTARWIQPLMEPTEGKRHQADVIGTPTRIANYLVLNSTLFGVDFAFYDASNKQTKALWTRPSDLTQTGAVSDLIGLTFPTPLLANTVRVTNSILIDVPPEWQSQLGPILVGGCCTNISGGTSSGPSAFSWTPGTSTVTPLLWFPPSHVLNGFLAQSQVWNGTTEMAGGFIWGRSLVYVYLQGLGVPCYGSPNVPPCGADTEHQAHGVHASPYAVMAQAYDLNELMINAAAGTPWSSRPYATWQLALTPAKFHSVLGVTLDRAGKRLFLKQGLVDNNGARPVIHVFQLR